MTKPAARLGDMHLCPMVTPAVVPVPHVGGPIMPPCYPPVLIGNMPAARIGDLCICVGPPDVIVAGSPTVFIGNMPAARIGDMTAHGGVIVQGWPTVLIGDAGGGPPGAGMPCLPDISIPGFETPEIELGVPEHGDSWSARGGGGMVLPKAPQYQTGFGKAIDAIVNKSPLLVSRMKQLEGKIDMEYGEKGKGTFYDADAKPRPKIVLDPNDASSPALATQLFSHEIGHALYTMDPYVPPDRLTRDQFVDQNVNRDLKNEGEATMSNAEVRDEIIRSGGPDIGIAGTHTKEYDAVAKKYPNPGDRDKARQEIGDIYADGEMPSGGENNGKTYRKYYAEQYEKTYDELHPKGK